MAEKTMLAAFGLAVLLLTGCMPSLRLELVDVEARKVLNQVIEQSNKNEAALRACCPTIVEERLDASPAH